MLPFKLIYHSGYDLNLGTHVFPSQKYRLIRERLLSDRIADEADFEEPACASDDEIRLVHDPGWVQRLKDNKLGYGELQRLEIPWNIRTADAVWRATGGSILAVERALRDGVGINIGGGFHHAFRAHGEGFCAINDIAVAIRRWQSAGVIERAMVIDCDVHHGNGTAAIFANDPSVATLSIHQFNNYPSEKPPSTVDINLPDLTGDDQYLRLLRSPSEKLVSSFAPQLLVYVAGADPYREDQLGGLRLTIEGLQTRDEMIFGLARRHGVPVAVVLAGGYAQNVEDTGTIHCNTIRAAAKMFEREGSEKHSAQNVNME